MEGKRRYLSILKVSRTGIESGLADVERSGGGGQRPRLSEAELPTGTLDEKETPTHDYSLERTLSFAPVIRFNHPIAGLSVDIWMTPTLQWERL